MEMLELAVLMSVLVQDDVLAAWSEARRRFADEPTEALWFDMLDAFEDARDLLEAEDGADEIDPAVWDGPWTMAAAGATVIRSVLADGYAPADWLVDAVEEQYATYHDQWDDIPPEGVPAQSMQRSLLDAVTLWADLVLAGDAPGADPARYEAFLNGSVATMVRDGGDSPELVEALTAWTALAYDTDEEHERVVDSLLRIEATDPAEAGAAFHNALFDRAMALWEEGKKEAAVDHLAAINDSYEIWGGGYWKDEADDHKRAFLYRAEWALDRGDFDEAQRLLDEARSLANVRHKSALLRTEARLVALRDGYAEFHGNGEGLAVEPRSGEGTSPDPTEEPSQRLRIRAIEPTPGPASPAVQQPQPVSMPLVVGGAVVVVTCLLVGWRLLRA
jgi:hypothetical protein